MIVFRNLVVALAVPVACGALGLLLMWKQGTGLVVLKSTERFEKVGLEGSHEDGDGWRPDKPKKWFTAGDIPLYYVNSDRDEEKQRMVETLFGLCGSVHRVATPDPTNVEAMNSQFKHELASDLKKEELNELNAALGHFLAIRKAFHSGDEVALILEDEASPILTPFWTFTLPDVVAEATADFAGWNVIRVQYTLQEVDAYRRMVKCWQDDPSRVVHGCSGPVKCASEMNGTLAYLVSRGGMKQVLDAYDRGDGGIACGEEERRCTASKVVFGVQPEGTVKFSIPQLFTYNFFIKLDDDDDDNRNKTTTSKNSSQGTSGPRLQASQFNQSIADAMSVAYKHQEYALMAHVANANGFDPPDSTAGKIQRWRAQVETDADV